MKKLNRLIAAATVMAIVSSSIQSLNADEYSDIGYGYTESRLASYQAPALALGVVALTLIIGLTLDDSGGGHGHGHSH